VTAVSLEDGEAAGLEMAAAPGGKVLAAAGHTVIEYLQNGAPNPRFGLRGRLSIRPQGESHFHAAAIAIDSKGRILVAGTIPPGQSTGSEYPGSGARSALVLRFSTNGRPDPSFGENGTVVTDFGLPPPKKLAVSGEPAVTYTTPSVDVSGLTIDSDDRPVITGSSIASVVKCYPFLGYTGISRAYVARLTPGGSSDPSFHGTGVISTDNLAANVQPTITRSRRILYAGTRFAQCLRGGGASPQLAELGQEGNPDPSFGSNSNVDLPLLNYEPSLALDRFGRILLAGRNADGEQPGNEYGILMRLSPMGHTDTDFGESGSVLFPLPRYAGVLNLAVDHRGRALLAAGRSSSGRAAQFFLTRRHRSGRIDRGFGDRGRVITSFGRSAKARGEAILVDHQGRIAVGGIVSSPRLATGYGFALARYLGGP
jgi:uncharacterized delta-60 repeat protein